MRISKFWKTILITAFIAAVLDLAGAIYSFKASRGTIPVNILKYIAGGILKDRAMEGGVEMHLLGGLFHYLITLIWTIFYFYIYPTLRLLQRNYFIYAIVYGILIWLTMNLIVLPLSAWQAPISFQNKKEISKAVLILIVCVALPICYAAKKYYFEKNSANFKN